MVEIVALGFGPRHQLAVLVELGARRTRLRPQFRDLLDIALQPAEGIEEAPVIGDIDQRPVGVLAVDFGEARRHLAQEIEAHRLVVDAGAARAVGILDAADHQFALAVDTLFLEQREGRMPGRQGEGRRHHAALGTRPHQA
jgi:hypothetical protein